MPKTWWAIPTQDHVMCRSQLCPPFLRSMHQCILCSQERLSIYRKKIQKVESEKWFKEHKRTLEVNVSAANRFISHAIPELTNEQRSALKRVPCQPPDSPCMLSAALPCALACQISMLLWP